MRPIGKAPSRRRVRFPRTPPQIIADLANQSERARSEDESLATFVRLVREARALVGPRSHFGERLNGDDRADYRRVMRRLDNLSRAELWEVSRFTVDLLWGIGFATHKRAAPTFLPTVAG